MSKIMVVALYKGISEYYCEYLKDVFGDLVEVENYYIENNSSDLKFNGDLIVTSSNILYDHVKRLNKNNVETIVMRRTFTKEGFDKLKQIDDEREAYFVSNFHEIAVECVSKLYELGIKNIKLIPYNTYSPYDEATLRIKTAVIAGKTEQIPEFIDEIIDIGDRILDLSTIADIGVILKLPNDKLYKILDEYKKKIVYADYGISQMLSDSGDIKKQMRTILQFTNDCIIATNLSGQITEYNDASEKNLGMNKEIVLGANIRDIFPEISIEDILQQKKAVTNELISIQHINYVVNKYGIYNDENMLVGIVIFIQKYMELEKTRNNLKAKLIPRGHVAKYNMNNILGNSVAIEELKKVAVKMAKSASTVLITGESGTGKEVFAQAIHNASSRSGKPFIAVNCSALAASLLESELFGYEEGAFTGAKKGGKLGLFEMADQGTIFLDEIGEMPYELQAKLLRVLMEREVMRIGGVDVIKIDVRVIAATNKNLLALVEDGLFREDLYYRVNVLPLHLPPLRERKEDILVLADQFLCDFGGEKSLSMKIRKLLLEYSWPGNIRELHNCIEYMYQLSEKDIEVGDMPETIRNYKKNDRTANRVHYEINELEMEILSAVNVMNENNHPAGRKNICEGLLRKNYRIGEQDVRFVLKKLENLGLVQVGKGRHGTWITDSGKLFLHEKGTTCLN